MGVSDWITAPAAILAAITGVLTYRRVRGQDQAVSWRLEEGPAGHLLIRTGGGVAKNVDIEIDDFAMATSFVESELHQDVVHPGAQIRVGTFMPASRDSMPGRVRVAWDKPRVGRKPKRERWSTVIA
jgi:hypothetical protein